MEGDERLQGKYKKTMRMERRQLLAHQHISTPYNPPYPTTLPYYLTLLPYYPTTIHYTTTLPCLPPYPTTLPYYPTTLPYYPTTCPAHVVVVRSDVMLFEFVHVERVVVVGNACEEGSNSFKDNNS